MRNYWAIRNDALYGRYQNSCQAQPGYDAFNPEALLPS